MRDQALLFSERTERPERTVAPQPQVRMPARQVRRPRSARRRVVFWLVAALILIPVCFVGGSAYHVYATANASENSPTDAIVVLGAAQYNGKPSPVFRNRLQHALDLYESGVAPRIITVGGKQSGDMYTEAGSGRQWLMQNGVPDEKVIAIQAGADTLESMTNVAAYAGNHGIDSITIDSDPVHMARAQSMAERLGFEARTSPTQSGDGSALTLPYLARETAAYLQFELVNQWEVTPIVNP